MKAFAEADRAKDMHGPNVAGPKATGTKYWSEIWIRLVCAVLLACHAERRHAVSSRYHVNAWISPIGIVILLENLFRDYFCFL